MSVLSDLKDYIDFQEINIEDLEIIPNKPDHIMCPGCMRTWNIRHFECAEYMDLCTCTNSDRDEAYYCESCDLYWDILTGEMIEGFSEAEPKDFFDEDDFDVDPYLYDPAFQKALVGSSGTQGKLELGPKNITTTVIKKCSHTQDKVELADGTVILCSSARGGVAERNPDFGLYADSIWSPTWRNEFINWPDFGLPKDKDMALNQIWDAYQRAKLGEAVEIGCIGGHGRTGTILGIMQVAASEGALIGADVVKFVRSVYCDHAIESSEQEWFIDYAAHQWYGLELPEKPAKSNSYGIGAGCSMTDHFAMMLRGHKECADDFACHWWSKDLVDFKKPISEQSELNKKAMYDAMDRLEKYDLEYGGVRCDSDPQKSPCGEHDHYIMLTSGHEECIRLGVDCTTWKKHQKDWLDTTTINGREKWEPTILDRLRKIYPSVEELKAAS